MLCWRDRDCCLSANYRYQHSYVLFSSWQFLWLNTDPARYQCYALTYWIGSTGAQLLPAAQCSFLHISTIAQPPLHMLPLEYPPFALVIFSLPLFAPLLYYQLVFAVLMALVSTLIYWLLLRLWSTWISTCLCILCIRRCPGSSTGTL